MIKIGVITAPHSINKINQVEPYIKDQCELTFIPYRKTTEIKELYEQNCMFYDGILFSGELGYRFLQMDIPVLETPVYFLDISEGDFYKRLFEITITNKNINFARVSTDLIFEGNGYMGLKGILKKEDFPYTFEVEFTEDVYEKTIQHHLSLWQQGKIDLVITRVSNVVWQLEEFGIPHTFIFPSTESILEQIKQIVNELQISNLLDNQWAIGIITMEEQENQNDQEFNQIMLHKALFEFNEKEKALSVIQRRNTGFEVITSQSDIRRLTNEFKECALLEYLKKALPFNVNIGWGIGTTLYKAKKSALTANKQAESNPSSCSYVINANEEVIGPLGNETCLHFVNKVDPQLEKLSESIGMSVVQIQKIRAATSKLQTNELTAEDIAFHLGLTLRQANRILNKLEEKGVAQVAYKKQEKLRGRPKKVYKLNFLN